MGRRALPKIDAAIDYAGHLLTLDDLPNPWSAEAIFGRVAPLEIDVGSGKGLFVQSAAAARPDHDFLGVEVVPKYARFSAARWAKHGLDNARMIHGDALRVFAERIADNSLSAVHVYFPDPWWKKRHRKRRVLKESFLRDIERTLRPGAPLHFWSDVKEYYDETLELLGACTTLRGPEPVDCPAAEHDMDYRTHFERRMRQAGEPVYRSRFFKPGGGR